MILYILAIYHFFSACVLKELCLVEDTRKTIRFGQNHSKNSHFRVYRKDSSLIFVIFRNFPYIDLWANFHLWVYCRIFYGPRNFSSKSMESQLSNALSNAFIALLVAEISSFQFQKSLSSHICRAFSYKEMFYPLIFM